MEVRDGEGKSALITYGKGNSFLSPISTYSSLSVQFFGGSSQPGSLLNPQYDSGESSSPSFLLLSLSFPHSPPQWREGWREGTPLSRHLDDCEERERIELQRKLIRRRAGPCTEGEKGGGGGGGGWQLVATLSPRSRAGISFRVHRFIEFPA